MSYAPRPRVVVNGVQRLRTYHYYWCRRCQRSIRTTTTNPYEIICPCCLGEVHYELDISRPSRTYLSNGRAGGEPTPGAGARLLDALATILDPSIRQRQNHLEEDDLERRRRARVLVQFIGPDDHDHDQPPNTTSNGMEGLLFQNDRRPRGGAPSTPTDASAIEALPTIILTPNHLSSNDDVQYSCPVCKDEFKVGEQVKELPCLHFYHSDCILPWLTLHNTCPVCRYQLESSSSSSSDYNNNNNNLQQDEGQDFTDQEQTRESLDWRGRRTQLFSVWPLSLFANWTEEYFDSFERTIIAQSDSDYLSWWRSWLLP